MVELIEIEQQQIIRLRNSGEKFLFQLRHETLNCSCNDCRILVKIMMMMMMMMIA